MSIPHPVSLEIRKRVKEDYPTRPDMHEKLIDEEINAYISLNSYVGVPLGFNRNLVVIEARKHYKSYIKIYNYLISGIESYNQLTAFSNEEIPDNLINSWKEEAKIKHPADYSDQLKYCEMKCDQYLNPYDPFVARIREICYEKISSKQFVRRLISELKNEFISGQEQGYIYKDYIHDELKKRLQDYKIKLINEFSQALKQEKINLEKKYADQYADRVNEIELDAIYKMVESKLISDPDFLNMALKRVQNDVCRSKENGEFPRLYELTILRCNQELLVKYLVEKFGNELIDRFEPELKASLLKARKNELLKKVKDELTKDINIIDRLKNEIKQDLVKQMFG